MQTHLTVIAKNREPEPSPKASGASAPQIRWLASGLSQAGGKLPLFDEQGRRVSERTVQSCLDKGWAEPWFDNPIKPDWQVCRLTDAGRLLLEGD